MKAFTIVAALSAAATVSAQGSAIIMNHCNFPSYVWAVDAERNPQSPTTINPGESYSEVYHTPSFGGVSLKVSNDQSIEMVTQFEYTVADQLYYDGSNINCVTSGCPYWSYNLYIEASQESCPGRPCAAETACNGFYQAPDDVDTLACALSANTILHLCLPDSELPTGTDSVEIPAGGAASSAAAAPAPATSSAAPAPTTSSSSTPPPAPTTTSKPPVINERPVATTFVTVTAETTVIANAHRHARDVHAHARRHMHHRS